MAEMFGPRGGWAARAVIAGALVLASAGAARAQGSSVDQPTAPAAAAAPDPAKETTGFLETVEVTGLVDVYYLWAGNEVDPQLRNFDVDHNTLSLNYAEIGIVRAPTERSRFGFRFDIGAGDTARLVNAFEPSHGDALEYVQQAYVSVLAPVGRGLTLDFGKFVTPHGAEVIENKDNFNYSRGLLFALAIPYYHAGLRASYPVNDKVTVNGYLVNGWNNVKDNNDAKTVAVSVALKPTERVAITQAYMVGKELGEEDGVRNLFDTLVSVSATDKLSVLGNFDYGRDAVGGLDVQWYGLAAGFKYQASERWMFSPRYEIFKDDDGFATGAAQTLQGITLTGEYNVGRGLLARAEFRRDFSDTSYFTKGDGLVKSQPTFAFGFLYAFSAKQ